MSKGFYAKVFGTMLLRMKVNTKMYVKYFDEEGNEVFKDLDPKDCKFYQDPRTKESACFICVGTPPEIEETEESDDEDDEEEEDINHKYNFD